jgi:hypothetical protein
MSHSLSHSTSSNNVATFTTSWNQQVRASTWPPKDLQQEEVAGYSRSEQQEEDASTCLSVLLASQASS